MHALSISDLFVRYGGVRAVNGISVDISPGELVAVMGANGAGKTSLLESVAGLVSPSDGRVTRGDRDVTGWPAHRLASHGLVLVPGGRHVFAPLDVEENLLLGAHTVSGTRKKRERLGRAYDLFPILQERRRVKSGLLSGGQQQMLAIARALMSEPEVVLLDEPSMGLAPVMVHAAFEAIRRIADQGAAVLIAEQNVVEVLKFADRGLVIDRGSVERAGTAEELLSDVTLVEAYLGIEVVADGDPETEKL